MADRPDGDHIGRRAFIGAGGLGAIAAGAIAAGPAMAPGEIVRGTLPWQEGDASPPLLGERTGTSFLSAPERAFVTAAVDRLIPAGDGWPSASQAGVVDFIDRQLAGPYGQGDHIYLGGPWPAGTPMQGYQSRFGPALYYRHAIPGVEAHAGRLHDGKAFADIDGQAQDSILSDLEAGHITLPDVLATQFFQFLLDNAKEGYFADPIYGGNRDMAGWRMIGFPGARYDYTDWVERFGAKIPFEPVGLTGNPSWRQG